MYQMPSACWALSRLYLISCPLQTQMTGMILSAMAETEVQDSQICPLYVPRDGAFKSSSMSQDLRQFLGIGCHTPGGGHGRFLEVGRYV